jgi:hypothetical protein
MNLLSRNILPAILLLLVPFPLTAAGEPVESAWIQVDEIVATIDGDPVLRSDILMEKDFGLLETVEEESGFPELLEAYLNRLLIERELDDIGGFRLAEGEAENSFTAFVAGKGGREAFEGKVKVWGVSEEEIFLRYRQALLASYYTENRIRFLVKVVPTDIEKAYEEDPEKWGGIGLFEAWDAIKSELMEESFEVEKERWISSLKERYRLMMLVSTRAPNR